jgi:hypothetical protein
MIQARRLIPIPIKKRLNFFIGIGMRDYELIAEMPSISEARQNHTLAAADR